MTNPTMSSTTEILHCLNDVDEAEQRLLHSVMAARANGVTWQRIADVFGHGDRAAAKRWYERRL